MDGTTLFSHQGCSQGGRDSDGDCENTSPAHYSHFHTPPLPAGKDGKDGESVTEIAGEYVARALFSRNWQLREAALGFLGGMAQGGGLGDKRDAFRTLAKAVQVCVRGGG